MDNDETLQSNEDKDFVAPITKEQDETLQPKKGEEFIAHKTGLEGFEKEINPEEIKTILGDYLEKRSWNVEKFFRERDIDRVKNTINKILQKGDVNDLKGAVSIYVTEEINSEFRLNENIRELGWNILTDFYCMDSILLGVKSLIDRGIKREVAYLDTIQSVVTRSELLYKEREAQGILAFFIWSPITMNDDEVFSQIKKSQRRTILRDDQRHYGIRI